MENVIPAALAALWREGFFNAVSMWCLFMSLSQIAAARQWKQVAALKAGAG